MDAINTTRERPSLSSAETHLLQALNTKGADERSVARTTSSSVPEVRSMITRLARKLELPRQASPEKEFAQLARTATTVLKDAAAPSPSGDTAVQKLMALPDWQEKFIAVGAAIAKGVLVTVDPFKIRPMPGQPRDYFPSEEQDSLAGSLGLMGQVQDIIIRKKAPRTSQRAAEMEVDSPDDRRWRIADTEYEICDGERRWRGVMARGILEIRAKLIEIDDEGAYLVAAVSNFNRVGHTTLERARNIERLMKGGAGFPIGIVAVMQGISEITAKKLLSTLTLPPDIHELMNPAVQRARGEQVLGRVPSYEVARLASAPKLHGTARELAKKYVAGELKLPQLRAEVDRALSQSGHGRDLIAERNEPARRHSRAREKLTVALEKAREAVDILRALKNDKELTANAHWGFDAQLSDIIHCATTGLDIIGAKLAPKKK